MGTDGYAGRARVYDLVLEPVNAPLRQIARGMIEVPAGGVVLDLGCGTGAGLDDYRRAGATVMGADPSPAMLAQARERLGDEVELLLMRASRVPFEDGCADLVLLSLVLHSLSATEARALLAETARLLAPGGKVLVTDFGVGGLRFPRGWAMRALATVAEIAAGPTHARHAVAFLRGGGMPGLLDQGWTIEQQKRTAGGNITVTVMSRA